MASNISVVESEAVIGTASDNCTNGCAEHPCECGCAELQPDRIRARWFVMADGERHYVITSYWDGQSFDLATARRLRDWLNANVS